MSDKQLPKTDSIEELAQFWDTHDLTDFEDELQDVPGQVFRGETAIAVHLPPGEAQALRHLANSKGIAEADLIRTWVLEKLHSA